MNSSILVRPDRKISRNLHFYVSNISLYCGDFEDPITSKKKRKAERCTSVQLALGQDKSNHTNTATSIP